MDNRTAFFQVVLGPEEGHFTVAFLSARTRNWQERFYEYPEGIAQALSDIDKNKLTCNVYFCPTILNAEQRVKESITHSKVIWADLDTCPPSRLKVAPSIILETSPDRYQAFWVLNDVELASEVEAINKAIAYAHQDEGCDTSGWDLTQMLRVPFTKNHKYVPNLYDVKITHFDPELKYELEDFDEYERVDEATSGSSLPEQGSLEQYGSADAIWEEHRGAINPAAWQLYINEPSGSWSEKLWQLELFLFTGGLNREQVFIVAWDAACNKYKRDKRSPKFLWKEVCRAEQHLREQDTGLPPDENVQHETQLDIIWDPPPLLTEEERAYCKSHPTFVEEYIEWAKTIGDAAWQYHQAGGFVILSSLLSGTVRLPTSFGTVIPNLWFMILADTTLTRKTTAMDMAMDLLLEVDPDCVLATDGSIEGLLTSLSMRPGRPSIFLRDEFSGLLEMITKRDYYAGMLETLTKLYDGKFQKRVLRKETLEVRDPVLVLFAGGIKGRTMQLLHFDHVSSGFIPRFCFITAESDVTKLRPLGPPTERTVGIRSQLIDKLRTMYEHYHRPVNTESKVPLPTTWSAELTPDAWVRYNEIEAQLLQSALDSNVPELLTPTFDRLCKSGLKAAVLLAASSRLVDTVEVTETDLVRAFFYVEQWSKHTMHIISNVGKSASEVHLDRVLRMISQQPGIPRSRIMQAQRLTAREADNVFNTLEQRGLIHRKRSGRGETFTANLTPDKLKGVLL